MKYTHNCEDGWVCEEHPEKGWPHLYQDLDGVYVECPGPGMLCDTPKHSIVDGKPPLQPPTMADLVPDYVEGEVPTREQFARYVAGLIKQENTIKFGVILYRFQEGYGDFAGCNTFGEYNEMELLGLIDYFHTLIGFDMHLEAHQMLAQNQLRNQIQQVFLRDHIQPEDAAETAESVEKQFFATPEEG